MKKKFLTLLIITIITFISCERDDICIDPVTPNLVIRFYDKDEPTEFKKVNNLEVSYIGLDKKIDFNNIDSIAIPLPVDQTNLVFAFKMFSNQDEDNIKSEQVTLAYNTEDVFVGRSCGYKTVFKNVTYGITKAGFIQSFEIVSSNIENENNAHVKIYY